MILLTGASGYVGSVLLEALSGEGFNIRALYQNTPPGTAAQALPGVEWARADLLDVQAVEAAMQGVTHVYHCAAIVSFDPADRQKVLEENVTATAHIADEALIAGVEKLVYVSSVAALGRNAATPVVSEEAQWEEGGKNSAYAESKWLAEMEVWRAMGEGMNAVIVNPGIILGPPAGFAGKNVWDKSSAALMRTVWKEFPFYTTGTNGFVDVRDVATAMMALMQSGVEAERFILSAGNFSYQEVLTALARAAGKNPPRYHARGWMTGLVWRLSALGKLLAGKTPLVTRETARTAQQHNTSTNAKVLEALPDFAFRTLEETAGDMGRAFIEAMNR